MQLTSVKNTEMEIMNIITKFYKDFAGKGPKDISVKSVDNTLIYIAEGYLTALEKNLMCTFEGKTIVEKGRQLIASNWKEERLKTFEHILATKIADEHIVIDIEKDTMVGILILSRA